MKSDMDDIEDMGEINDFEELDDIEEIDDIEGLDPNDIGGEVAELPEDTAEKLLEKIRTEKEK